MQRSNFLDIVKGFLIMLVCVGHANQYVVHQNDGFWQDPLFKSIYMFHMPLFMAVAGYLSFQGITTKTSLTNYIKRRSVSTLLPIFTWAILYQIVVFLLTDKITLEQFPFTVIRYAVTSLWFLWALYGAIVLTVIATSTKKYSTIVIVILFLATLALPEVSHFSMFKYTLLFFIAGFYCASCKDFFGKIYNYKVLLGPLAIASYCCFLLWDKNTYIYVTGMVLTAENLQHIVKRWLVGAIVSTFILFFLSSLYPIVPDRLKNMIISAGKNSIYIYILQSYVFLVMFRLSSRYLQPVPNVILGDLLAILIGILVTYLCLWIGNTLSRNKYGSFLLFGKIPNKEPKISGLSRKRVPENEIR